MKTKYIDTLIKLLLTLLTYLAFKNLLVLEKYFFAKCSNFAGGWFAICASSLIIHLVHLPPHKKKSKNEDRSQKRLKTQIEHVYNRNNGENCGGPLFFREDLRSKGQNVAHEGQRNWAEDQRRENKLKGDDNQCSRIFLYFPIKALLT